MVTGASTSCGTESISIRFQWDTFWQTKAPDGLYSTRNGNTVTNTVFQ